MKKGAGFTLLAKKGLKTQNKGKCAVLPLSGFVSFLFRSNALNSHEVNSWDCAMKHCVA